MLKEYINDYLYEILGGVNGYVLQYNLAAYNTLMWSIMFRSFSCKSYKQSGCIIIVF